MKNNLLIQLHFRSELFNFIFSMVPHMTVKELFKTVDQYSKNKMPTGQHNSPRPVADEINSALKASC